VNTTRDKLYAEIVCVELGGAASIVDLAILEAIYLGTRTLRDNGIDYCSTLLEV
jgi:hypothetical protein